MKKFVFLVLLCSFIPAAKAEITYGLSQIYSYRIGEETYSVHGNLVKFDNENDTDAREQVCNFAGNVSTKNGATVEIASADTCSGLTIKSQTRAFHAPFSSGYEVFLTIYDQDNVKVSATSRILVNYPHPSAK